jgi:hypothetical protein
MQSRDHLRRDLRRAPRRAAGVRHVDAGSDGCGAVGLVGVGRDVVAVASGCRLFALSPVSSVATARNPVTTVVPRAVVTEIA